MTDSAAGPNFDYKAWLESQPRPVSTLDQFLAENQTTVPSGAVEPNSIMYGEPEG